MSRCELLTPIGRLVQGSLYSGATTDAENKPLVYKSGANLGQPRVNFWFALALEKKGETHWNQTEWGKKIWEAGQAGFPDGRANSPTFAWKVVDGDSLIPNSQGKRPSDNEGFPKNWILKFSGAFAPSLFNENGTLPLIEPNAIQLGDYIQVYGYVEDNKSNQQPGVYLNHSMIARSGYGQRIVLGADPKSVGFGGQALPAGASATPVTTAFQMPTPPPYIPAPVPVPAAPEMIEPYPGILIPAPVPTPSAPAPGRIMLPAANGVSYAQYISAGWTDTQLIQLGYMQA
jgi:hypothetical protein